MVQVHLLEGLSHAAQLLLQEPAARFDIPTGGSIFGGEGVVFGGGGGA